MNRPDQVEFWLNGQPFLILNSSHAPMVGDFVSIRGVTYRVRVRNFAVDYVDSSDRRMRLVVQLEKAK